MSSVELTLHPLKRLRSLPRFLIVLIQICLTLKIELIYSMPENESEKIIDSTGDQLIGISQVGDDEEIIEADIQLINVSAHQLARQPIEFHSQLIKKCSQQKNSISEQNVRVLITLISSFFKRHLLSAEYEERKIRAIITKFRDAGRRSAPWKPTSERVPGRPQDGDDGNRRNRWLFHVDHKFYATEINATLVEIKYFLQALSMEGVPPLPLGSIQNDFSWLIEHSIEPGAYLDPIQLTPIPFEQLINEPRTINSGHLTPLDRGGRHIPGNAFLMLYRSNQIQGNQTLEELTDWAHRFVQNYPK